MRSPIAQQLGQLAPAGGGTLRLLEVRGAEVHREAAHPEGRAQRGTMPAAGLAVAEHRLREPPRLAILLRGDTVGRHLLRFLGGLEERVERLRLVVAAHVVMREQRRVPGSALGSVGLEQRADALVELAALLQEQPLVRHLLRQALAEAELVARERGLAMHQAASLELREHGLGVDPLAGQHRLELPATELAPEHGGDLDDALGLGREGVEARRDDLLHRAGDGQIGQRPA